MLRKETKTKAVYSSVTGNVSRNGVAQSNTEFHRVQL